MYDYLYRMTIVSKHDPIVLVLGDIVIFTAALWLSLLVRNFETPSFEFFLAHLYPFSILFLIWIGVFLLAGLYDRASRLLRTRLPESILYAQTVNVILAAVFFFLIPVFGVAPKAVLLVYLAVSSVLIFSWRVNIYPRVVSGSRAPAIMIASGDDVSELVQEVNDNPRYPLYFTQTIETDGSRLSEAVQQVCRIVEDKKSSPIIVADTSAPIMQAVLPIVYDVAFTAPQFTFLDVNDLYQEVFERVSLANLKYDWVLAHVGRPATYDVLKRVIDISLAIVGCLVLTILYPFVALAIKLEDGGSIFIQQDRIGRHGRNFKILKFRSMNGDDGGKYDGGKTKLTVTRVGKVLRRTHIDEFPQFINLLFGDLSFVGPRPELPPLVAQYSAKIPFYNARHLITPGLTGWARIRHLADPHHGTDIIETKKKLSYDLYYMKHRSLLFDINIILQTVKLIFGAKGM